MAKKKIQKQKPGYLHQQWLKKQGAAPVTRTTLLLYLSFVCGSALLIWQIYIYRQTFIPIIIPLSIFVASGLAVTVLFRKFFNIYLLTTSFFLQAVHNTISVGGTILFLFMFINYYVSAGVTSNITLAVTKTGSLGKSRPSRCNSPFVVVNYKGLSKDLIFTCGTPVEMYHYVDITLHDGLFGFEVITGKRLHN